jgi:hypothetical protein
MHSFPPVCPGSFEANLLLRMARVLKEAGLP